MKGKNLKSEFKRVAIFSVLRLCALIALCIIVSGEGLMAQSTPRWVDKGVKDLNKKRSNDTYEFWIYHNHGQDINEIEKEAQNSLMRYVDEHYFADSIEIKTVAKEPFKTYEVSYNTHVGKRVTVVAELIDTYSQFDDYEYGRFEYEYYQLYAISKPGSSPKFDDFTLTKKYNSSAVAKSLIPGLGQLYKGQKAKGYVIMGGEIFLLGAGVLFNYKANDARKMRYKEPEFASSWRSKQHAWMNFRLGSFSSAAVLYVANLIDAAISKGATQVVVSKPSSYNLSLHPYASIDGMGMSIHLTF